MAVLLSPCPTARQHPARAVDRQPLREWRLDAQPTTITVSRRASAVWSPRLASRPGVGGYDNWGHP
ncbi:MAG TPA: hypothetical protein VJU82_08950, partial [Acidobacteriaceae bacterium]|nr:hypothetical protein [Acidobacteriaceae bacterium]